MSARCGSASTATADVADRVRVRDDLLEVTPYGAPQLDVPVRLNTNEMPFPPPAAFSEQLAQRVAALQLHRYPDRRAEALRTRLGERFGLGPERVWAANGSNEILLQLFQAYGGAGRSLLLTSPGYSAHPLIARVTATDTLELDLDDSFSLNAFTARDAMERLRPDLVCLANPNNPTGATVELDAIRALHDAGDALIILDEAYVEFGGTSGVALLDELPRLVVCRTFSKAWRLAGLRLGYLLAHEWVIDDLRKVRLPYHLDMLTQEAGLTALDLADEVTAHIAAVSAERERLHEEMQAIDGVQVWPSAANFLLFRSEVPNMFSRLLDRGVLVRDFSDKARLGGCLRVSIGTREEDDLFLQALRDAVEADD